MIFQFWFEIFHRVKSVSYGTYMATAQHTVKLPSWWRNVGKKPRPKPPAVVPVPLKWVRRQLHITQTDMWKLLQAKGIQCTLQHISAVERGTHGCSSEMAIAIGEVLTEYIIGIGINRRVAVYE